MIIEIKIPSPGESITEVAVGNWLVEDGSFVEKDQEIAEVETDKATLTLISPESGKLRILVAPGQKINVGDVACTVDTSDKSMTTAAKSGRKKTEEKTKEETADKIPEQIKTIPEIKTTPLARKIMDKHNLDVEAVLQGLKRISREDVELVVNNRNQSSLERSSVSGRVIEKSPMSPLRRKLSKRLVAVKNETAMLTTFNEVDMSTLQEMRRKYQKAFQEKYGIKLGLMSFFIKASAQSLAIFPKVNSMMNGDEILTPQYVDIAVAVQSDKGLMVPVIRNVQDMALSQIEIALGELAQKARESKLSIEEMTGGTFTITNGGVFGSMLSTPILNPPQSAILGMHNIVERPVAISGRVEIRPIMYLALSYDHRLIDGRDSVSFLLKIKELIESPVKMILGADPEKMLLGL